MKTEPHRRTRHLNILLVLLAVAGLIAIVVAIDPLARASQATPGHWTGYRGTDFTGMAFCDAGNMDRVGQLSAHMDTWLDLDPVQSANWNEVARELERGFARLANACKGETADSSPATMPERLALMESALAAGTETLRSVQPVFAAFYATLNEEQRRKIDSLPGRHGVRAR